MPVADVNGVRINYLHVESQQGGDSEHVVMVHGLATNLAFWYMHYVPILSKTYHVTLFDMRGHGRSEMTKSGYTPQNLARDLRHLLGHLGIGRAHIIAHSFGGVVALNMACADPRSVSSLVLADTHISAVRGATEKWPYREEIQAELDRNNIALDTNDPYFGYRLLTEVAHLQVNNEEISGALMDLVSPLLGKQGTRTASQWLRLMDRTHAEAEMMGDDGLTMERLKLLRFPILAMYGSRSQARQTGKQLLDVWPHAEFRSVREAGHFFPVSRPGVVINNCKRFWDGEFEKNRMCREGERSKSYFRSDRMYQADGAWYCLTRESAKVGPFAVQDDAQRYLASYISEMKVGNLDAVAQY